MQFQKAIRTKLKARMAIDGPTGAGKTYTALMAASAFTGASTPKEVKDGKIAVLDTERGSAKLYADIFNFDVLELDTYGPLQYVEAIGLAQANGYEVLVIDSLSHAWEGEGGALDQVDQKAAQLRGNSYAAWRTVTPQHRKMITAILKADMHVIVTMRSKMEYILEEGSNGKSSPRKIGLAPIQRSGTEYEFTWVVDMDLDHTAAVNKSRAADLADLVETKPNVAWFGKFYEWLVLGVEPPRTKEELVEFGSSIGLAPADIGVALKEAGLEWDPSPDQWATITNAVVAYTEKEQVAVNQEELADAPY